MLLSKNITCLADLSLNFFFLQRCLNLVLLIYMKENTLEVVANVGVTATTSERAGNMELSTCLFDRNGFHLFSVHFECQPS